MLSIYTLVLWKFFSSFQITPIYVDCSSVLGNIHCVSKTSHLGSPEMQDAKIAKNRHLGTIAQICRAISAQLRHILTIGKKTC